MQLIHTALENEGHPSLQPFPTTFTPAVVTLSAVFSPQPHATPDNLRSVIDIAIGVVDETDVDRTITASAAGSRPGHQISHSHGIAKQSRQRHHHHRQHRLVMDRGVATNCFEPLTTGPIPSQIPHRGGHPVPRLGIVSYSSFLLYPVVLT